MNITSKSSNNKVKFELNNNGSVLAYAIVVPDAGMGQTWLTNLYVEKGNRGMGYARMLVDEIKKQFPDKLYVRAFSHSDSPMTDDELVELYKHLGFKSLPNKPKYYMVKEKVTTFKKYFTEATQLSLNILYENDYEDKITEYFELLRTELYDIVGEFLNTPKGSNRMMSWSVIPFARLNKIWQDYAKYRVVRDEKGIDYIIDNLTKNLARLEACNILSGHSIESVEDYDDTIEIPEDRKNEFYWEFLETPFGTPISDYGTPKLIKLLDEMFKTNSYEEKLVLIDRFLNIIHQRGDLSALFIEGGAKSLNKLSGVE